MRSFVLQDWITIRGAASTNVTQGESDWLDLAPYQDISIYLDVREVTPSVGSPTMHFETSPNKEDVLFQDMVSPFTISTSPSNPYRVAITTAQCPVARYVRWRIVAPASLWDATFRVLVSADALGL